MKAWEAGVQAMARPPGCSTCAGANITANAYANATDKYADTGKRRGSRGYNQCWCSNRGYRIRAKPDRCQV